MCDRDPHVRHGKMTTVAHILSVVCVARANAETQRALRGMARAVLGRSVTSIIIWNHDGLIRSCYVDRMQLATGRMDGFVRSQRHVPR